MMDPNAGSVKSEIDTVRPVDEKISNRGGLSLISKYLSATGITGILASMFGFMKKSAKGTPAQSIFHQLICFFFDGTDFHLTRFDQLKQDAAYSGVIETDTRHMLSSHSVKRFFANVSRLRVFMFRKVLHRLFLWRLHREKPEVITLGIDTMVMDNDDARCREGVQPTYKNVKGFQPLQVFWGRYLIDAVFREGNLHSNHGNHVRRVVTHLVSLIRSHYRQDIPILIAADAGFFDQKLFSLFDELGIGFIIGGKMYKDLKEMIGELPSDQFFLLKKDRYSWMYTEFGDRRKSWDRFYRCLYTLPLTDEWGQYSFEFHRPEVLIYTNLGMHCRISERLATLEDAQGRFLSPEAVIRGYHQRARDELVNRGFKEFGTEHLPFKHFSANAAYYYLMAISFFLFESFKYDMGSETIPVTWYASTFRRRVLDVAGKLVRSARRMTLCVPRAVWESLRFDLMWRRLTEILPIPSFSLSG